MRPAADGLSIARAALAALAARWRAELLILLGAGLLYLAASAADEALLQRIPVHPKSAWVLVVAALLTFAFAVSSFSVIAVGQRVLVIDDLARARMPFRPRPSRSSVVVALSWLFVPSTVADALVVVVILRTVTYVDVHLLRAGVAQFWLAPVLYWLAWMARRLVLGDAHAHIVVGGLSAGAALRASTMDLAGRRAASVAARLGTGVPVLVGTAIGLLAGKSEAQTVGIALVTAVLVTSFDAAVEAEWYRRLHDTVDASALSEVFD